MGKNSLIYNKIVEEQPYCQLCGSTNWLQIHHIVYRSENGSNDKRNLIRLCSNCHKLVHSNKKRWQPFLLNMQMHKYGKLSKQDLKRGKKQNEN